MPEFDFDRFVAVVRGAGAQPPETRTEFVLRECGGDVPLQRAVLDHLAERSAREGSDEPPERPKRLEREPAGTPHEIRSKTDVATKRIYACPEALGRGGSGVVFRATNTITGERVAIKILRAGFGNEKRRLSLLHAELQFRYSGFSHPHIAKVYTAGMAELVYENQSSEDAYYVETELIEGTNLRDRIRDSGAYSERIAAGIVLQLASAAEYAHEKGLIHCDISPKNVMVQGGPTEGPVDGIDSVPAVKLADVPSVKLIDFGSSVSGDGTERFMAPELRERRDRSPQTDVYSVGAVLLYLIAGESAQIPWWPSGPSGGEYETALIRDPIREKCLCRSPSERYRACDLATDLKDWLADRPVRTFPEAYSLPKLCALLVKRCQGRNDPQDHADIVGLALLLWVPFLVLGGVVDFATQWYGSSFDDTILYGTLATFVGVIPITGWIVWLVGWKRDTITLRLLGGMMAYAVAFLVLRVVVNPDGNQADASQLLLFGITFSLFSLLAPRALLPFIYGAALILAAGLLSWFVPSEWLLRNAACVHLPAYVIGIGLFVWAHGTLWPVRAGGSGSPLRGSPTV